MRYSLISVQVVLMLAPATLYGDQPSIHPIISDCGIGGATVNT
jgi:hypothetical protein